MTSELVTVQGAVGTFDALVRWQRFLEVSGKANANTRRQYRRLVLAFLADVTCDVTWSGPRDPWTLTEDDLVTYLADYTSAQGAARGMTLRALRSLYGWADARDLVAQNPAQNLHPPRPKYGPAPSLTETEVDAILAEAEHIDPRARWAIQLQFATGCRIGSLVEIVPADVRSGPQGPSLVFTRAKYDRAYEVPLGPQGAEAVKHLLGLMDYLAPKTSHRLPTLLGVGPSRYRQWLGLAADRAGVKAWSHLLRHTTATLYAAAGVDTRTMMEQLNWESPAMMRRYAARSDVNLRAAAL